MIRILINFLFGNLEFFEKLDYSEYWKSKFKITRIQIETTIYIVIILFIGMTFFQLIMNQILIEFLVLEFLFFFVCLRLIFFFIHQDFKNYIIKAEIIGYFVVHELLIILESSKSLKDATKFIITSNYMIYSEIFLESLIGSHFGQPLKNSLRFQINNHVSGELKRIFLNVIDTWETGFEIAMFSTDMILTRLSDYIREETDKVDTRGSLFSGLIFLSPPVIFCFLLLSGQMSYLIGLVLIVSIIVISMLFRPDRHLSVFTDHSPIIPFTDNRTIEFLVILAENLSSGLSYTRSLNKALNIYIENSSKDINSILRESIIPFRLGTEPTSLREILALKNLFSFRTITILDLIEKFSQINTKLAGSKLLTITKELNKTGNLLRAGKARLKATSFQTFVIQICSIISLAFISGASPLFQLISSSVGAYKLKTSKLPNFDPISIFLGFLMSLLPLNFNFSSERMIKASPVIIIRMLRFILFMITFIATREILKVSFQRESFFLEILGFI